MYILGDTVEIAASPEKVREKFLDFSQIPNYHKDGFFKAISPAVPDKPLEPGDVMHNTVDGMTFKPVVLENSPAALRWVGSIPGLFSGEHIFRFDPSTKTPGGTTFVQEEKFTGALQFLMGDNFFERSVGLKEKTQKGFEQFNRDLKRWCEES
ncbi:hypothetical protein BS50DRAFT_579511 [Corynespora cassiicola Philippines]|uniref:Uncharacterized protein n=1 Tax=Corynespora cassiicola Philippines TaxID=1448308 RepID=A0A2T2N3H4_CORCC|nr:hypothetical protein BS50DRAFT_579511 [Corynespora cassiicola Philippines]